MESVINITILQKSKLRPRKPHWEREEPEFKPRPMDSGVYCSSQCVRRLVPVRDLLPMGDERSPENEGEHLEILEHFAAHLASKSMSSSGVGKPTWQSLCGVGSLLVMHTRTAHRSRKHWKLKTQSFTRYGLISTALRHHATQASKDQCLL